MPAVFNTAEGGSTGVTATTSNTGGASGTAFNTVSSNIKFDNTQAAHGSLSYRSTTASAVASFLQWNYTPAAAVSTRMYIRFNAITATQQFIMSTNTANFVVSAAGLFQITDASTTKKTFATTISAGVWYRIELESQAGTTTSNGYVAGRYFLGDSTTPAETQFSSNACNAGTGAPNGLAQFGQTLALGAKDLWMDDLGINPGTTTPIGPAAVAATGTAAMALAATATAVPAALFAGWGIPL